MSQSWQMYVEIGSFAKIGHLAPFELVKRSMRNA